MKTLKTLVIVALIGILSGCSSISTTFDYNVAADFGQFKTFGIISAAAQQDLGRVAAQFPTVVNTLNLTRIETAIRKEMLDRGYVESENPDLWINYFIMLDTRTEYQISTTGMGGGMHGPGWYGMSHRSSWGGMSSTRTNVTSNTFTTGSLVIDIIEASTNTLAWFGIGSAVLSGDARRQAENVPRKVSRIFRDFRWVAGQSEQVSGRSRR